MACPGRRMNGDWSAQVLEDDPGRGPEETIPISVGLQGYGIRCRLLTLG